jgi:hypothetical protein
VTTFPTRTPGITAGRLPHASGARPASAWAFAGVAVTSFGGPLALAALNAPGIVAGSASASAGLAMVAAVAVFAFPLAIWFRYARRVNGPGGLCAFVEAAAGRRVAMVQAGLWIVSYLLYLLYTTAQIVYDALPAVFPGERRYQPVLVPFTLINPERIYNDLLTPSLVALWLSQLIVFAVYPRFATRHNGRPLPAWVLTAAATAFAVSGLWATVQHSGS